MSKISESVPNPDTEHQDHSVGAREMSRKEFLQTAAGALAVAANPRRPWWFPRRGDQEDEEDKKNRDDQMITEALETLDLQVLFERPTAEEVKQVVNEIQLEIEKEYNSNIIFHEANERIPYTRTIYEVYDRDSPDVRTKTLVLRDDKKEYQGTIIYCHSITGLDTDVVTTAASLKEYLDQGYEVICPITASGFMPTPNVQILTNRFNDPLGINELGIGISETSNFMTDNTPATLIQGLKVALSNSKNFKIKEDKAVLVGYSMGASTAFSILPFLEEAGIPVSSVGVYSPIDSLFERDVFQKLLEDSASGQRSLGVHTIFEAILESVLKEHDTTEEIIRWPKNLEERITQLKAIRKNPRIYVALREAMIEASPGLMLQHSEGTLDMPIRIVYSEGDTVVPKGQTEAVITILEGKNPDEGAVRVLEVPGDHVPLVVRGGSGGRRKWRIGLGGTLDELIQNALAN